MKVVHPGRPDQAGGCDTGSAEREITRMNMHKNARLTPQGRRLLVQRVTEQGWTVAVAASAAGLSQRQAYRWLARYGAGGTAVEAPSLLAGDDCEHSSAQRR
jgi:transposase-like protein